jgi:hypothetical protein
LLGAPGIGAPNFITPRDLFAGERIPSASGERLGGVAADKQDFSSRCNLADAGKA